MSPYLRIAKKSVAYASTEAKVGTGFSKALQQMIGSDCRGNHTASVSFAETVQREHHFSMVVIVVFSNAAGVGIRRIKALYAR